MNTTQLEAALNKHVASRCHVLGALPKDKVPATRSLTRFPCCCIANTDNSSEKGEHWVAFWFESPESCEFFDSYGFPPSTYNFTHNCNSTNTKSIQSFGSNVCGEYCLYYLYFKSHGQSLFHILSSFDSHTPDWNDHQVRRFVNKFFHVYPSSVQFSQCCISRNSCIASHRY